MRTKALALVLAAIAPMTALAGCVAPPVEADVEAASIAAPPEPGLLEAPREVHVPAGDSYTVLWLNATERDWVAEDGTSWLRRAFEFPEGVDIEAYAILWLWIEGDKLSVAGTHLGSSAGAGSSGRTGDAAATPTLVALQVLGASEAFPLRFGISEEMLDFDLQGETVPADVVDQGEGAGLAWYLELASPLAPLFGGEPLSVGFDVDDGRTQAPGAVVGAAGALELAFEHPVAGPSVHAFSAMARTLQGQRVGSWSLEHELDGEVSSDGGLLSEPFLPWAIVRAAPETSVSGRFVVDVAVEAMPLTSAHAFTVPLDAERLGLALQTERIRYGGAPVVVTPAGCFDPSRDLAPTLAACASTEA